MEFRIEQKMEMDSQSIKSESVINGTGRSWEDWFKLLDDLGAKEWTHKEMAKILHQDHGVSTWWAQTLTVEYERKIGRREIGQNCKGNFQASASKTLPGTMDQIFLQWQSFVKNKREFNGLLLINEPQVTLSSKWRYWRIRLEDGGRVAIIINQKDKNKVLLSVNHEKLSDARSVINWKTYWQSRLREFDQWLI